MCFVCRKRRPKHELFRLRDAQSGLTFDPSQKTGGRGLWICRSDACVCQGAKRRFLGRVKKGEEEQLRVLLSEALADELDLTSEDQSSGCGASRRPSGNN